MKQFLKAQNKTNELVITGILDRNEIDRAAKSEYHWADRRGSGYSTRTVRKGEIYQFEFGKNDIPEMSYEHRGIVIGVKKRLLYVLPIFSYKPAKHPDVYHPVDNPGSKSDLYLLKRSEFSFITHDSVLKLNDLRTVSVKRILYPHPGRIDPASDTYKNIEALVLQKYFPDFYREYVKCGEAVEALKGQVEKATGEKTAIEEENEKLKQEMEAMKAAAK